MLRCTFALLVLTAPLFGADWVKLIQGRTLEGWDSIGDGIWSVMRDGTILGQRPAKGSHQAWLYTKKEYTEFDLKLEYWTRDRGNSGISIRDTSRGAHSVGEAHVADRTPSHIGYEIQIWMGAENTAYPSGSIYLFAKARTGVQIPNDWNLMEVESRRDRIRVKLNGTLVSEHAGDPKRGKRGPIGLQLHDPNSIVMFRNIEIRELP